jgi:hypothetical protein
MALVNQNKCFYNEKNTIPFNFEKEIIIFLEETLDWSGEVYLPLPNAPRVLKI